MDKEKILNLVIESVKDLSEELDNESLKNSDINTKLYGRDGNLDSLTLVSLITDLEGKIYEQFKKEIVIADERAMSQKRSPFKDINSLTDYIEQLLQEV